MKDKKSVLTVNFIISLLFSLIFLLFAQLPVFPQSSDKEFKSLYPSAAAAEAGKITDMDDEEFIRFSLIFSGVAENRIESYMDKYRTLARGLENYFNENSGELKDSYSRGNAILEYLHESLFKKYNERTTAIDILFDRGIYNCVSSGILYYALALESGLDVYGVRTKDHAFCAVKIDGRIVDVETTTEYGFDPGEKKEFISSFGETGFVYTPPSNYKDRTDIDEINYLSLILQNRISEMQRRGNYADTVQLAVDRYALTGSAETYNEMINDFKNHAAYLNNRKEYEKGILFLEEAYSLYADKSAGREELTEAADKLFYNQIINYLDKNLAPDARKFHEKYKTSPVLRAEIKNETLSLINDKIIYLEIMENGYSESLEIASNGVRLKYIDDKTYSEYLVFIYSREIQRKSVDEGWIHAYDTAKEALNATDNDSRIKKLYDAVEYNISVFYHNEFVKRFNAGDREDALEILNEGLAILPGNKRLTDDLMYFRSSQ